MKKFVIFILFIFLAPSFLVAENIDIEIYLRDEYKGEVFLNVDGKDLGTIPYTIEKLSIGYHYFKIRWIDESGKVCIKTAKIKITQEDRCLYLSTKEEYKKWKPFLFGFLGGIGGVLIFGLFMD